METNAAMIDAARRMELPEQDGSLRFMLLGTEKNTKERCDDCTFKIRDRRPGPVKVNSFVCVDRAIPGGRLERWIAKLCKGCAVRRYAYPAATLAEIYWTEEWDENTNVKGVPVYSKSFVEEPPVERFADRVSRYSFLVAGQAREYLHVERTSFDADAWAIRWSGRRLNKRGAFPIEPSNSSRSDHYLATHTFPRDQALELAASIAADGETALYDRVA
jgi:hypothetical protein